MTLDFKKMVLNAVRKEMAVQHFECNAQLFGKDELPYAVVARVKKAFGDTFLNDANYTLWFSGSNIDKETVEKTVFKICNAALARSANDMNASDLKFVDLAPEQAQDSGEEADSAADSTAAEDPEKANGDAISDLMADDVEADGAEEDGAEKDDAEEDIAEINDQIDAELGDEEDDEGDAELAGEEGDEEEGDEEDEEDEIDESVESPGPDEKFVFLKITMK